MFILCESNYFSHVFSLQSRNILQLIRDKVGAHFVVSPEVSLSVSTVDRFVQTFRAIISEHETFHYQHTEVNISTVLKNYVLFTGT
jgi:hypothetical protein